MQPTPPPPSRACPFCLPDPPRLLARNDLAYAVRDAFPVADGHALVLPRRHVTDFFGLTAEEREACAALLHLLREALLAEDPTVAGFTIGMNVGAVAGQTIFHSHIHLIPRRVGDVENPRGGVRMVIPHQGRHMAEHCPFGGL